jgi:predicted transcriptional regulator
MGRQPGRKFPSPLSLRLDDELRRLLEEIAEEEERPVGMMARILLREAMAAREGKRGGAAGSKRKGKPS